MKKRESLVKLFHHSLVNHWCDELLQFPTLVRIPNNRGVQTFASEVAILQLRSCVNRLMKDIQGSAKRWALGCVDSPFAA